MVTTSWSESSITWDHQPVSATVAEDTVTVPGTATNDFIYWYIDDLVQAWIDGSTTNHGVVLRDTDEATSEHFKSFFSSDYSIASKCPKLVIEYYDPADS